MTIPPSATTLHPSLFPNPYSLLPITYSSPLYPRYNPYSILPTNSLLVNQSSHDNPDEGSAAQHGAGHIPIP